MTQSFIVDNVGGISGSLTTLVDGTSYLVAGTGISVTSQSNGSVLVASSASSSPTMQSASFISNGSWTSPVTAPVILIGFGGGGGGGAGFSGTPGTGGGGGGGTLQSTIVAFVTSGSTYSVTIGAGGAGGSGNGSCGADTTFGSLATFCGASGGGAGITGTGGATTGGGLCIAYPGPSSMTTAQVAGTIQTNAANGVVNSVAAGGWSHAFGGAFFGMRNCIGGHDGGTPGGQSGNCSGGAGGGAGPAGDGAHGGNAGTTGTAGSAGTSNTGAGGGGGGAGSSTGANGGAGGSGMLTIVFFA